MHCPVCRGPLSTVLFQAEVPPYCPKDCSANKLAAPSIAIAIPVGWTLVWYAFEPDDMRPVNAGGVPGHSGSRWYFYGHQFTPELKPYLVRTAFVRKRRTVALADGGTVEKVYVDSLTPIAVPPPGP